MSQALHLHQILNSTFDKLSSFNDILRILEPYMVRMYLPGHKSDGQNQIFFTFLELNYSSLLKFRLKA